MSGAPGSATGLGALQQDGVAHAGDFQDGHCTSVTPHGGERSAADGSLIYVAVRRALQAGSSSVNPFGGKSLA